MMPGTPPSIARLALGPLLAALLCALPARAQEAARAPRAPAPDAGFRLTILHTNDIHGQVLPPGRGTGGLVALGRTIRQERDRARARGDAVLLLDAGDIFKGTPEGDLTDGQVVVAWMNHLGYDALAIGNHEFDQGLEVTKRLALACAFPVLGANITEQATDLRPAWLGHGIIGVDEGLRGAAIVRTLRSAGGAEARVAVVGMTTSGMKLVTLKGVTDGLVFEEEAACLQRVLAALPPVDLVVLLTHCGVDVDQAIAERFADRVDVIIGGHSHTRLAHGARVGSTLIAQTGAHGALLGRVRLGLSVEPRRVTAEADLVPAGDDLDELLAPFIEQVKAKVEQPVGNLGKDLPREGGYRSSALGNLHCDLMRASAGADVALTNKTGIRADLKAGVVRERDIYQVAPFGNTVATVRLAGRDLRDLLEGMLASTSKLLELSGCVVTCDPSRPEGQRLVDAQVGGAPLDPARTYLVATNNFLVTGGDGHVAFTRGTEVTDTNVLVLDLLRAHFKAHDPYDPGVTDERILTRKQP